MKPEDIKPGDYAKVRGSWGYIISVDRESNHVMLSGWCGFKTSTFNPSMVSETKTREEFKELDK